jgi:hypothetical protein
MEKSFMGFTHQVAAAVVVVPNTELGDGTSSIA